jgi:hypothetical protein
MDFIQAKCKSQQTDNQFKTTQDICSIESAVNDIKVIVDMRCGKYEKFIAKKANKYELIEIIKYVKECVLRSEPDFEADLV